jgi:hypothetical protein
MGATRWWLKHREQSKAVVEHAAPQIDGMNPSIYVYRRQVNSHMFLFLLLHMICGVEIYPLILQYFANWLFGVYLGEFSIVMFDLL